jgi:hypothetical protein
MALSRALRDVLRKENGLRKKGMHSEDEVDINDNRRRQRYAKGGEVKNDHWMQEASEHSKKGALHRELDIPEDRKISTRRLEEATHSDSDLERKRANLALRYRGK